MKKIIAVIISFVIVSCFSRDDTKDKSSFVTELKGKIVFATPVNDPRGQHLAKLDINKISDTIVIPTVYGDYFKNPKWSPNGEHILYSIPSSGDGRELIIISDEGAYQWWDYTIGVFDYFSWSPTGSLVLVGQNSNYITDTIQGNPVVAYIPDSIFFESNWLFLTYSGSRWTESDEDIFVMGSPNRDSRFFLIVSYGSYPDSLREIYRYNYITKTIVEQVTHNQLDEAGFEISSDQQKIVFSHGNGSAKVTYLMNISDTTAMPIIQGKHKTVRWFGKTHYLYYVRFPNPTVYFMDTDHPEKEYELMAVYDENIDIWAELDSVGE